MAVNLICLMPLEKKPVSTIIIRCGKRLLTGLALVLFAVVNTQAANLIVGDQSYSAQTVMQAAGVLKDLPYELEWKQFTAGSPVA
ncbi:ABC transporter, periplasmic substrate-binding protein, aliphatic sulfonates family [Pseudomonas syringae pv. philadelphi]|nr:ABC transporter, periplasmic substrate-binding protein, aliphatic sulfonates family [Pseudomonas syringae pv. philadelphi]RMM33399.1 ABC transporter, periplasmic substrate-binding protein [Pseudomonas syringae pv. berberidis]RMQ28228.1 ABC transporter, periplasmic substrate-binding protein [Pseudomonas syringae pv. berberidis]